MTVGEEATAGYEVEAGIDHFTHPFGSGGHITIGMWRNETNIGGTLTGERPIVQEPKLYDYNPVSVSGSRKDDEGTNNMRRLSSSSGTILVGRHALLRRCYIPPYTRIHLL